ncbi:chitin deacetylase, carbohydrate esterase family 4 protein [Pseudohyphozyma bogoriensis]|nr:chitin deacetylase, carbohydrate esterase family 4 protein [Pseudohyphozyma bogoriensis]
MWAPTSLLTLSFVASTLAITPAGIVTSVKVATTSTSAPVVASSTAATTAASTSSAARSTWEEEELITDPSAECTAYSYAPVDDISSSYPDIWVTADLSGSGILASDIAIFTAMNSSIPDIAPKGTRDGNFTSVNYNDTDPDCWWSWETELQPQRLLRLPEYYRPESNAVLWTGRLRPSEDWAMGTKSGHPYMTSMTNEQAFAELYYSKKAIKDVLGISVRCWRPPYGDVDDRIRYIAEQLDMVTIVWEEDTNDWEYTEVGIAAVEANYESIIAMGANGTFNTQGTIVLTHELDNETMSLSEKYLPSIRSTFTGGVMPIAVCMNFTTPYAEGSSYVYPNYEQWMNGTRTVSLAAPTAYSSAVAPILSTSASNGSSTAKATLAVATMEPTEPKLTAEKVQSIVSKVMGEWHGALGAQGADVEVVLVEKTDEGDEVVLAMHSAQAPTLLPALTLSPHSLSSIVTSSEHSGELKVEYRITILARSSNLSDMGGLKGKGSSGWEEWKKSLREMWRARIGEVGRDAVERVEKGILRGWKNMKEVGEGVEERVVTEEEVERCWIEVGEEEDGAGEGIRDEEDVDIVRLVLDALIARHREAETAATGQHARDATVNSTQTTPTPPSSDLTSSLDRLALSLPTPPPTPPPTQPFQNDWTTFLSLVPSLSPYTSSSAGNVTLHSHIRMYRTLRHSLSGALSSPKRAPRLPSTSTLPAPSPLLALLTPETMLAVITRDSCNSFGLWDDGGLEFGVDGQQSRERELVGYAVYPSASFFNHSCSPNVVKKRVGVNYEFRALKKIEMARPPIQPTTERFFSNHPAKSWVKSDAPSASLDPTSFHKSFPSYAPTPLVSLPTIASELGVKDVYLKDESSRLGLPAFKILGASWATFLALSQKVGIDPATSTLEDLVSAVKAQRLTVRLHAATDGNHGRAVAHMGSVLGLESRIVVPSSVSARSQDFIRSEAGCTVVKVDASYDEAVAAAAQAAEEDGSRGILIQDTSWAGYETIPLQIVQGYTTLFREIDDQLASASSPLSDTSSTIVAVPVGVGSLAHAAVLHYRSTPHPTTSLLAVEPTHAPCLLTSLLAGTSAPITTKDTIMPGLNCGTVSPLAWPDLQAGIDVAVSVEDREADAAVRQLQALGVDAGPCGAAPLAGVKALLGMKEKAKELGFGRGTVVILISTEGSGVYLGA